MSGWSGDEGKAGRPNAAAAHGITFYAFLTAPLDFSCSLLVGVPKNFLQTLKVFGVFLVWPRLLIALA